MRRKLAAYSVHVLTASGAVFALLAALELTKPAPDPRLVFLWLIIAVAIDALDGPLARGANTLRHAAAIDGRTIDDILDFITYTFLPLVLVLRMDWIAGPRSLAIAVAALAMIASLFGFAHVHAKDEKQGSFRGFPSYWNVAAYYFGLLAVWYGEAGRIGVTIAVLVLALLTLLPVRFVYPNLAPKPWRAPIVAGAVAWGLLLLGTLPFYPHAERPDGQIVPALIWLSLLYPAFYVYASVRLDRRGR